ncbi:helix-turn-helix domain-containing protein [Brevibacillus sp. WF146]|uniref:helix-turn-helix domain-containing protein n=1 Tax=Brevibacillus sp. WF146 TaxID=319501 RepID=UPI0007EC4F93|nr:helix-turn-helix domain-containing protein [Brevibacillus sp. WF146]UYZ13862.1 helix-turn-helix domain-containing protein [Brevibacillus sp. WF146]UYZ13961.1 helix-turn-helix domain-containing protein [Brevibacillus sp. WF146]UYZ14104.1 helix-turn-helix domain-containing protein [Brevibacillus sp. WF146]UYZ15157.1 helix-turn-helix domain-containing protein [Brevibacillus sp. WF146]
MTYENHTIECKLEVVKSILEEGLSYREAAKRFGFKTHSNVKNWVHAYKIHGVEGLKDRRGQGLKKALSKIPSNLTLEQENKWLRAQNAFLKKLLKTERRDAPDTENTPLFKH